MKLDRYTIHNNSIWEVEYSSKKQNYATKKFVILEECKPQYIPIGGESSFVRIFWRAFLIHVTFTKTVQCTPLSISASSTYILMVCNYSLFQFVQDDDGRISSPGNL